MLIEESQLKYNDIEGDTCLLRIAKSLSDASLRPDLCCFAQKAIFLRTCIPLLFTYLTFGAICRSFFANSATLIS